MLTIFKYNLIDFNISAIYKHTCNRLWRDQKTYLIEAGFTKELWLRNITHIFVNKKFTLYFGDKADYYLAWFRRLGYVKYAYFGDPNQISYKFKVFK